MYPPEVPTVIVEQRRGKFIQNVDKCMMFLIMALSCGTSTCRTQ